MDLRVLCHRLDMDNLKAKMSNLPQLKLLKALPKFGPTSRLFRKSCNNSTKVETDPSHSQTQSQVEPSALPTSLFINRTPQHISTISSLMHEQVSNDGGHSFQPVHSKASTYRSAGCLEDDYYAPCDRDPGARASRPISPIQIPAATSTTLQNNRTLTQRLHSGYQRLSELRLKHLFAKQTTLRRDDIEVNHYVEQYEADYRVEKLQQARIDRQIADNYDIHIRTLPLTRQNTPQHQAKRTLEEEQQEGERRRCDANVNTDQIIIKEPMHPLPDPQKLHTKPGIAATRFSKMRQPPLPMPIELPIDEPKESQPIYKFLHQKLKRLRLSIKHDARPGVPGSEEEIDQETQNAKSKTHRNSNNGLRARLRKLFSSERSWRKSFKRSSMSKKPDQDLSTAANSANFTRDTHVPSGQLERTLATLNEKIQQIKFLQRRGVDNSSRLEGNKFNTVGREPNEIDEEELDATYHHSDSSDDDESSHGVSDTEVCGQLGTSQPQIYGSMDLGSRHTMTTLAKQLSNHSLTAWSSESMEEDATVAVSRTDYPRVLIHQQHTDTDESTLIIAVATTHSPSPSPPLTTAVDKNQWVSNQQIITDFTAQPQKLWSGPALYKAKSVNIFNDDYGAVTAFADFDEALRNAPVLRIGADSCSVDSGEDADDSSSRVTKIQVQASQFGNSCESLMEQQPLEDKQQENKGQVEMAIKADAINDRLLAGRLPPILSSPPPLPQRRSPTKIVPPPLPLSTPPILSDMVSIGTIVSKVSVSASLSRGPLTHNQQLTQRSASMRRPAKPLVKTSSLRLTYNEQMHPGDVGKVNKLISRFEGGRPRISMKSLQGKDNDEQLQNEIGLEKQLLANVEQAAIPNIVTTQSNNNSINCNLNNLAETEICLSMNRQNSNCSRSEYGSPLAYPLNSHQRHSSTPTVDNTLHAPASSLTSEPLSQQCAQTQSQSQPQSLSQQRAHARRSRRSITRDDDNFYSFDSDEDNSYYSISPSSSSRYVVEI